jgi:chorismate mutase
MTIKNLPLNQWLPGSEGPLYIAGPCSAENPEQMISVAREIKSMGQVPIFRAGVWKPRTRPNSFEGHGEQALKWLRDVKNETGLMSAVEVASPEHVEAALKHDVDILWIGARTTVNPFSVQAIADSIKGMDIPVFIKNPINADLALWIGAIERIAGAGINKLAAIHRGFSTAEKTKYRNHPMWWIPIELKRHFPNLPLICDPSHIAGDRHFIGNISQAAMDLDMDGLMIETHCDPDNALSDAKQQVTPKMLSEILSGLNHKTEFCNDKKFEDELERYREQVDRIDAELIGALKMRMDVVNKIGLAKAKQNITAFQVNRMEQMVNNRVETAKKQGLRAEYIEKLYQLIHEESVKTQTNIMNQYQSENNQDENS